MDRPLQRRDINEPIERLVREHFGSLEIPAIHYGPLTRALQDVVHDLIVRAQTEAVAKPQESDPMPVFVIKGKDKLAPRAVDAYAQLCDTLGLDEQRRPVDLGAEEIRGWQQRHPGLVKLPDHPHVPAKG